LGDALAKRNQRAFTILRATTLLIIPSCWIVSYYEGLYPREGHFLWLVAMVLALFSNGPHRAVP